MKARVALSVLAILALALVALPPRIRAAKERARAVATTGCLFHLARALDDFALIHGQYPVLNGTGDDLRSRLKELWPFSLPIVDGWGRPIRVLSSAEHYRIASYGRDGVPDVVLTRYSADPNADIVIDDRVFVSMRQGVTEPPLDASQPWRRTPTPTPPPSSDAVIIKIPTPPGNWSPCEAQ